MKVAVIGGGTAGFIAAAHVTRKLPAAELLHVFDSGIPTIGVGEGTTPRFPDWFHEVTGLGYAELEARCRATLKRGTHFEGWGAGGAPFLNRFQPARLLGYHFDAAQVVKVLDEHVRAERVDARVARIQSAPEGVRLELSDGRMLPCDYAFDARGFPPGVASNPAAAADSIHLSWVPTGRALLRWLPKGAPFEHTRAIARPHGWIFQIPLRDVISSGYIFNPRITTDEEAAADYTAFLESEGVGSWEARGTLPFPNFTCREWFDGRVFRVGNASSFLEPLEATAIGTAIVQIRTATHCIEQLGPDGEYDAAELEDINRSMLSYVCRNSLFIGWHYARGSRWETPFWAYARAGMERAGQSPVAAPHLIEMEEFVQAGQSLPGRRLAQIDDQDQWDREVYPSLRLYRPFGNFSELNFAQVGHGIGFYGPSEGQDDSSVQSAPGALTSAPADA